MCPMCGCTTVILLGVLGPVNHLRCRACGWTWTDTDTTLFQDQQEAPYWAEQD